MNEACRRVIQAKKRRIEEDHHSLLAHQKAVEVEEMLLEILAELLRCPEKVRNCRRAVLSDMYMNKPEEPTWHRTVYYPHRFSFEDFCMLLGKLDPRFTEEVMKNLRKANKQAPLRLLLFCTKQSSMTKVNLFSLVKVDYADKMFERSRKVAALLKQVAWDSDFAIDWAKCGRYLLEPEFGEKGDAEAAKAHRHKSAILKGTTFKVRPGTTKFMPLFRI